MNLNPNLDLELKALELKTEKIERTLEVVRDLLLTPPRESDNQPEFYTVEDCWKLKGAAALNTYKSNRFLLPGCGNKKYEVYICGRLAFPRNEVLRWAKTCDSEYLDYARECGVTVIPEKYMRLIEKAKERAS